MAILGGRTPIRYSVPSGAKLGECGVGKGPKI